MKDAYIKKEQYEEGVKSVRVSKDGERKSCTGSDLKIDKRKLVIYSEIMKPKFD